MACGEAAPSEPGPLAAVDAWRAVAAGADPFSGRPPDLRCSSPGFGVEGEVLEVETDKCAWVTLTQPALRDVAPGDRVRVRMWHQPLAAEQPGRAYMGVRLGAETLAEVEPPIPGPPRFYELEHRLNGGAVAGAPVYLHVHNHGVNSYRFGGIELLPSVEPP